MADEYPTKEDGGAEAPELILDSDPAPWKLHFAWGVLCLFLLGMVAGLWSRLPKEQDSTARPPRQKAKKHRPAATPQPSPVDTTLTAAERELRAGRHRKALAIYLHHTKDKTVPAAFAAFYGVGLCHEALGQSEEAAKTYRRIALEASDPVQQAAAHLGLARMYLRRRNWRQALAAVSPILLRSAAGPYREHACVADARYLSGLALARLAPPPYLADFWNSPILRASLADLPLLHTLAWFKNSERRKADVGDRKAAWKVRYRDRGLENVILSARFPPSAIDAIIATLAERLQAKLTWSREVRKILAGHHAHIDIQDQPLSMLLSDLLDPLGVVAAVSGDQIRIASSNEADRIAAAKHIRQRLERRLRDAVLEHPHHVYAAQAMLELGNAVAVRRRHDEALLWYAKVKKAGRHDRLHIVAAFNSGLLHRLENRSERASEEFYYVIDSAPANALAPAAYLELGRGLLYHADFDEAAKVLEKGLNSSVGSPVQAELAISLAAAYLLTHRPAKTHEILRRNFIVVRDAHYRSSAAVLDALSRFRLAGSGKKSRPVARDLLAALINYRDDPPLLGPIGILIVGEAYRDLGFPSETARLFASAYPALTGPIAERMRYNVGEYQLETEKIEAGKKLLHELAEAGETIWAERAALRLAKAALDTGNPQECIRMCRQLLRVPPRLPRRLILQQMGLAYDAMGNYENASLCFAGKTPPEKAAK